jgi:hypothetical protein
VHHDRVIGSGGGLVAKALARCGSRLQGTPLEGRDLAAQPRAAAEDLARNHGTALAQAGAAYRQEQKMSEATFTGLRQAK